MQLTAEELKKLLGRDLTTVRPEILAALTGQQQPGAVPGGAPGGGGGDAGGLQEPLSGPEIELARSMISGRTMMTSPMSLPLPSPSAKVTPEEKPSAKPPAGAQGEGQDRLAMGVSPAEMDTDITKPTAAAAEEPAAEGFPGWAKAAIAVGGVGLLSAIIANQIKQERKSDIAPSGTRMIGAGLSALGQFMGQRQRQQAWQAQQEQDRMVKIAIAARKSEDAALDREADILIASIPGTKSKPPVGLVTLAIRYNLGNELLKSWPASIPEGLTEAIKKDYEASDEMDRLKLAASLMRGFEGLQYAVMMMDEEQAAKHRPLIEQYTNTITELVGQAPAKPIDPEAERKYASMAAMIKEDMLITSPEERRQAIIELIQKGFDPNSPEWQKHIAPLF